MAKDTALRAMGWAQSFPVSQGVRAGRRWTREHLASLEWTRDAAEIVDAILLSVSELVTNAHVHAHSDAQLVLTWDSHCLHVSVHDSDPLPPARQPEDVTTTGGADWLLSTHSPTAGPRIRRRRGRPSPRASYHRALQSLSMAGTSAEFRGGSDRPTAGARPSNPSWTASTQPDGRFAPDRRRERAVLLGRTLPERCGPRRPE